MQNYAQTNVQLFNQLRSHGYSDTDRCFIRDLYRFATAIFSGIYLPSGKPLLDHLVGTASILASLRVPIEIVAAGLLHAAYLHGDFGTVTKGMSGAKRTQLRSIAGDQVEQYIARYDRTFLRSRDLSSIQESLDGLDRIGRDIILLRLANELEHRLDLGGLYSAADEKEQRGHQRYIESRRLQLVMLAERLGFRTLAAELDATLGSLAAVQLPLWPYIRSAHHEAFLIAPRSCRERLPVRWFRHGANLRRLGFRVLRRAKLFCVNRFPRATAL
jgi:hypothetical protein